MSSTQFMPTRLRPMASRWILLQLGEEEGERERAAVPAA
jgi:hypothetical protein